MNSIKLEEIEGKLELGRQVSKWIKHSVSYL